MGGEGLLKSKYEESAIKNNINGINLTNQSQLIDKITRLSDVC